MNVSYKNRRTISADFPTITTDNKTINVNITQTVVARKERNDKGKTRKKYNISKDLPDKYREYLYRSNAKKITFELSIEQFNMLLNGDCQYCGEQQANGIDRINSKKGYISNNVVSCCIKCNIMKYTHSVNDFIKHVKKIYHHTNAIEL